MTFRDVVLLVNPHASSEELDRIERQLMQLGSIAKELTEQGARAARESGLLDLVNGIRSSAESLEAKHVIEALRAFGERSRADFAWLSDVNWDAVERNLTPMVATAPLPYLEVEDAPPQELPQRRIGFVPNRS